VRTVANVLLISSFILLGMSHQSYAQSNPKNIKSLCQNLQTTRSELLNYKLTPYFENLKTFATRVWADVKYPYKGEILKAKSSEEVASALKKYAEHVGGFQYMPNGILNSSWRVPTFVRYQNESLLPIRASYLAVVTEPDPAILIQEQVTAQNEFRNGLTALTFDVDDDFFTLVAAYTTIDERLLSKINQELKAVLGNALTKSAKNIELDLDLKTKEVLLGVAFDDASNSGSPRFISLDDLVQQNPPPVCRE